MGSVKKKISKVFNKVADKIVPKEIAPILPIAAMFIPGLQGMSPLLRYGLPQLATALSSAKTTGKINPMAQILTGLTSYAAGPGGQTASGKQDAFFNQNVGQVDPGLAEAAGGAQGMTGYELVSFIKNKNKRWNIITFCTS